MIVQQCLRPAVVLAASSLVFTAGCGTSSPEPAPPSEPSPSSTASVNPLENPVLEGDAAEGARSAADTYLEAVRTGDGQVGCFVLTEDARAALIESATAELAASDDSPVDCATAFHTILANPATTAHVDTVELSADGTTATVHVTSTGTPDTTTLTLVNTGGAWLVDDPSPL